MAGKLYLVATPIGNLEDMSFRAVKTLAEADYILAEDTRHSIKLLNHYEITKKLVSYHEHNQFTKAESILEDLRQGKQVALITDAGTPGISDPGSYLVLRCQEEKIDYTIIPGPVALINALVLSGQNTNRFVFEGFLPMKNRERQKRFEILKDEMRTIIFYEAPHKLKDTLKDLHKFFGDRQVSLIRELTKIHEEVLRMSLSEAISYYQDLEVKGEFVVILEGLKEELLEEEKAQELSKISLEEQLEIYLEEGLSKKDAIKRIAKERNLNKRDVYQHFVEE